MDIIIYIFVGLVAIAVIFETLKRGKSGTGSKTKNKQNEIDSGPYLSADETDPTQTGRMKVMNIKKSIHGGPEQVPQQANMAAQPQQQKQKQKAKGAHNSINHEKVEANETGGFELPDPFSVDVSEESKE